MGRVAAVIQQPNPAVEFMNAFTPLYLQGQKENSQREAWAEYARQLEMMRGRNQAQQGGMNTGFNQANIDPQGSFVRSVLPAMLPLWYGGGK